MTARKERDFTVRARVRHLKPGRKYFYRFQVDGRRDDQSIRIGANGRLLSIEVVAQWDAGWHRR